MTIITKGKLLADDWGDGLLETVGSYWTPEAVAEHYTVCISYMDKLISMDKGQFSDWLQLNHLYIEDEAPQVYPSWYLRAMDPFDVGLDCE